MAGSLAHGAVLAVMLVAGGYHLWKLFPYAPAAGTMAVGVVDCPSDRRVSLMLANVELRNRQAQPLLDMVARVDPHLFLAMETDAWWDRRLSTLAGQYPERVQ